jgi:hypothetical protein
MKLDAGIIYLIVYVFVLGGHARNDRLIVTCVLLFRSTNQ